jgi:L-fuconolactonase
MMAAQVEMIDAHHHLWPLNVIGAQSWRPADDGVLRRAFEPDELSSELEAARVTGTVLMQSVDDASENVRLLDYAHRADFIRGVVAWAPLTRPRDARTVIRELARDTERGPGGSVVGVRCLIGHDDADWALTADGIDNFRRLAEAGLSWDIVPVNTGQVAAVAAVAERVPQLRVIVDHLARPPLNADGWDRWCESVRVLATQPRVAIKLSVGVDALSGSTAWDRELLRPYVEHAVAAFGARRAMVASNWPVVLLQAGYAQAWSDTIALAGDAVDDADALARLTAGTAIEWYGLNKETHT